MWESETGLSSSCIAWVWTLQGLDVLINYSTIFSSEMDFLSNLLPGFPSLDPTSEFQNVTFLQNAFIATFLASLGATTIRNILGGSFFQNIFSKTNWVIIQIKMSHEDTGWRVIRSVGWPQVGGRSVGGPVRSRIPPSSSPPAWLAVTQQVTASLPWWLITNRPGVSARAASSILTILDCGQCQTSHVSFSITLTALPLWRQACVRRRPKNCCLTKRTAFTRFMVKSTVFGGPQWIWSDPCVITKRFPTSTRLLSKGKWIRKLKDP